MPTDPWSSGFNTTPDGTESKRLGDNRIRETRLAVQERMDIDHDFSAIGSTPSGGDTGYHIKATFKTRSNPSAVADAIVLFAKDVAGKAEAHFIDEDSNVVQITDAGALAVQTFPATTEMIFHQAAAPTAWTITADNDRFIRIMTTVEADGGATSPDGSVTSGAGTAHKHTGPSHLHTGPSHVHTGPDHNHSLPVATTCDVGGTKWSFETDPGQVTGNSGTGNTGASGTANTGLSGTGDTSDESAHTHAVDMDFKYTDCIIASKD